MKARRSRAEVIDLIRATMPWEEISIDALSPDTYQSYRHRKNALEMYMDGRSIADIKLETSVDGSYIRKMIERCLKVAPDGLPYGLRALLPNFAIKSYTRTKSLGSSAWPKGSGLAGVLDLLFERYPDLKTLLDSKILKKKLSDKGKLANNSDAKLKSAIHEFAIRPKDVHSALINYLENQKHPPMEWPLNTKYLGARTISDYVRKVRFSNFTRSVIIVGDSAGIAHIPLGTGHTSLTRLPGLLEGIEIDSHTIDADFVLGMLNSAGIYSYKELKRLHILAAVEIAATAVLWFRVVYGDDVTDEDVVALIREMFGEKRPVPEEVIPGLRLKPGAGFPADLIPELRQALPTCIHLDNALVNLSTKVNSTLRKQLGAVYDFGVPGRFERRPTVENTFGRLAADLFKRLPSTTGAGPDKGRAKNPGETARRLMMESNVLEQLTYTYFANHNAEPSQGLGYESPLSAIQQLVRKDDGHFIPRLPPIEKQKTIGIAHVKESCCVKASLEKGLRPYINFEGARYSSDRLKNASSLIGKKIIIEVNERDIRVIHAFLETGEPLGPLTVLGAWSRRPHSRKLRKEINSLKHKKILWYVQGECPVDAYMQHLDKKIRAAEVEKKQDRSSASKLDKVKHEISNLSTGAEGRDVFASEPSDPPISVRCVEPTPDRDYTVPARTIDLIALVKKL